MSEFLSERMSETVAVIDFETSGLGPANGGRATEILSLIHI